MQQVQLNGKDILAINWSSELVAAEGCLPPREGWLLLASQTGNFWGSKGREERGRKVKFLLIVS